MSKSKILNLLPAKLSIKGFLVAVEGTDFLSAVGEYAHVDHMIHDFFVGDYLSKRYDLLCLSFLYINAAHLALHLEDLGVVDQRLHVVYG